jgi:hypothetical protein
MNEMISIVAKILFLLTLLQLLVMILEVQEEQGRMIAHLEKKLNKIEKMNTTTEKSMGQEQE